VTLDGVIRLGALLPLSGAIAPFGEEVLAGHDAYWDYVNNELGGMGGTYQVELLVADHAYDEELGRAEFEAMAPEVAAIVASLGSPIDDAVAAAAEEAGLLMSAGSLSSQWVGHPALIPNLAIPSYRDQVAAGLIWAAEALAAQASAAAVLYQESAYGEDCVRGFELGVEDAGLVDAGRIGYPAGATDFGAEVEALQGSGAGLVVVCATPDALVRVVATFDGLGFDPALLVSSASYDAGVPEALGGDGGVAAGLALLEQTWVTGATPDLGEPGMKLAADVAAGADGEPGPYFFFGYSQALTFHLIFEEALDAGDLSRAGLQAAAQKIDDIDLGLGWTGATLTGSAPVPFSAVGWVGEESFDSPFGVPASGPYILTPAFDS
jgi:ABC-type branched-subunit amino acid transport system substrate-binding protein